MALRDISLKEEYRSDRDDIVTEFFVPCLSNCIEYDRCIEYISLKSLTTLALGYDNFAGHKARIRVISGHRFGASDLDLLSRLFSEGRTVPVAKKISGTKIKKLQEAVSDGQIEIKIAIPNSEEVVGSFSEKIGIFLDEHDDAVAFTGTSNETFSVQNRGFESVDVFTSWNDATRVKTKIDDFENLWENRTKYVEVYSFSEATSRNLLKYSPEWAIDLD